MLKKKRTAYSLLELSIVIVIISILITGAMTTAAGSIAIAKVKITKDREKLIYNALGTFIATNGRLPCPANILLTKSDANYGVSVGTAGTCSGTGLYASTASTNLVYGMVPVVSLGLSKDNGEDGFEDKIAYVVDKNFTATANLNAYPNFTQVNFSIYTVNNTGNNITIYEKSGGSTITPLSNGVFVLISYGANKNGAFGINSTTQNTVSVVDADEESNDINIGSTPNFDQYFTSIAENSDTFDDIILYSSPGQMVAAFDLYRLLPCRNNLNPDYNANNIPDEANDLASNAWFGQTVYGDSCTGSDFDKNYIKKCGAAGTWIVMNTCTLP